MSIVITSLIDPIFNVLHLINLDSYHPHNVRGIFSVQILWIFVCQDCGTERKRSDRLALHMQWHEDHPGDSYQTRNNCKICGRFNATYFMLKMHMTRMHTDMPKTFQCQHEGCGKAFRVSTYVSILKMSTEFEGIRSNHWFFKAALLCATILILLKTKCLSLFSPNFTSHFTLCLSLLEFVNLNIGHSK